MSKQGKVSNPLENVAAVASASSLKRNPKLDSFSFDEVEARSIFQESLSRASNQQYISVDSLHRKYHQYPNKLALTSTFLRQGLDQFQKVLLQQDNTTGILAEDDFIRGLHQFETLISSAENKDEILQEIESMAVQIAGQDSASFSDLIHLPDIFNSNEIESLMQFIINDEDDQDKISIQSPTQIKPLQGNHGRNQSNGVSLSMTTPSPSGKITSASIKRVSILSSSMPR